MESLIGSSDLLSRSLHNAIQLIELVNIECGEEVQSNSM
jgi:hypothetical protein